LFRIPDHGRTNTTFDRIGRIATFNLGQNRGVIVANDSIKAH
jgi:hypothetical protein